MKENDVKFFSTLLDIKAEDVETAATDGTLGSKITALELLNKTQVETLKTNLTKEVKSNHVTELTESAKKGELDPDLYKVIKGASYEMLEKDLSKEYGVDEFKDVKDLVAKISNKATKTDDKTVQELNDKLAALKEVNQKLDKEKSEMEPTIRAEYEGKLLSRDRKDMLTQVPFDFSDVDDDKLETVTSQRRQIVESVFNSKFDLKFEGDKTVVVDKQGDIVKNPTTLDPLSPLDVLKSIPTELGIKLKSPESGGQGGSSSGGKNGQFKSEAEFYAHLEAKGIQATSKEGIDLFGKSGLAVKK